MYRISKCFMLSMALMCTLLLVVGCSSGSDAGGSGSASDAPAAPAAAPAQPQAAAAAVAPEAQRPSTVAPLSAPTPKAASSGVVIPTASSKVKRLVVSMAGPAEEYNAATGMGGTNAYQLGPMYEWTATVSPDSGAYEPMLAENWTITNDSVTYKFREGVQFHNGWGELTAYDFADSVASALHPDNGNSGAYNRAVASVEVLNDREAKINLKTINVTLFRNVSQFTGGWELMSSKHFDEVGDYPGLDDQPIAGTGPYQFIERSEGSYVRFKRVPYKHWRVTPDFEELELRFIVEESTRLAALLVGEIHVTPLATDMHQVAFKDGKKIINGTIPAKRTLLGFQCCYLNDRTKPELGYVFPDVPLMDVRVRRAISKAVDRDSLNKALFGNGGRTMYVQGYNERSDGWNAEWKTRYPAEYAYDPAGAKALLAEAGFGPDNPYELDVILLSAYRGLPEGTDLLLAITRMIEDVGVKIKLETMDSTTMGKKARAFEFDNHIALKSTSSDLFTNAYIYASQYARSPGAFVLPRLNELHLAARGTMDQTEHSKIFAEIGQLIFDNVQAVPLLWVPNAVIYNPEIISGWAFPGSMINAYSHWDNIKAAG